MRDSRYYYEYDRCRGPGIRRTSGAARAAAVLGVLSVLSAALVVANFGAISAWIAIRAAGLLSRGFPILLAVIVVLLVIVRARWKHRRRCRSW